MIGTEIWPDLGSNSGRRGGKAAINSLSYGTAKRYTMKFGTFPEYLRNHCTPTVRFQDTVEKKKKKKNTEILYFPISRWESEHLSATAKVTSLCRSRERAQMNNYENSK
jgi:hypothetical protein